MKNLTFLITIFGFFLSGQSTAKDYNISNQPIYIPNEFSRCISRSDDAISLIVKGMRFQVDGGLIREDKKLGIVVGATPQPTSIGSAPTDTPYEYPVLREVDLAPAKKGFVQDGGRQYSIINLFPLRNESDQVAYTRIDFGVKLIKTRGTGSGFKIVQAVFDQVSSLQLPSNPYTESATRVAGLLNGFVNGIAGEEDKANRIAGTSQVSLAFNRDGQNCNSYDDASTGFVMFLFEPNGRVERDLANGILPISSSAWSAFCFKVDVASKRPQFASQIDGSCENIPNTSYQDVNNPYVLTMLRAEPKETQGEAIKAVRAVAAYRRSVFSAQTLIQKTRRATALEEPLAMFKIQSVALESAAITDMAEADRIIKECEAYSLTLDDCLGPELEGL
ncbi:MAG: hypothetical protein AAFR11_04155 [Pseudomonadota bacterium]